MRGYSIDERKALDLLAGVSQTFDVREGDNARLRDSLFDLVDRGCASVSTTLGSPDFRLTDAGWIAVRLARQRLDCGGEL